MSRVTSKRQVTLPKAIADRYGIAPGDEIEFVPAGATIRVRRMSSESTTPDRQQRLARFDQATQRQQARGGAKRQPADGDRGWRREELYERGSAR